MFYNSEVISLEKRISNIQCYLCCQTKWELIGWPIIAAFIGLFLLNIAKAIGLALKISYDNWLSPYIQKLLYNKNIIEKSIYEKTLKAYRRVQQELDEKEGAFRELNDELESLKGRYKNYQFNSIETHHLNTADIFDMNFVWLNKFVVPGSSEEQIEKFTAQNNIITLTGGEEIEIENRSVSNDGFIYIFEKHFKDGRILKNILVKYKDGNYHGLEAGNIKISYIKEQEKSKYVIR